MAIGPVSPGVSLPPTAVQSPQAPAAAATAVSSTGGGTSAPQVAPTAAGPSPAAAATGVGQILDVEA